MAVCWSSRAGSNRGGPGAVLRPVCTAADMGTHTAPQVGAPTGATPPGPRSIVETVYTVDRVALVIHLSYRADVSGNITLRHAERVALRVVAWCEYPIRMVEDLKSALSQMERALTEADEVHTAAAAAANEAKMRADAIRIAVDQLRRFLGESPAVPTQQARVDGGALVPVPDHEVPPSRRRGKTSSFLSDLLLKNARPMTKDEIVEAFTTAGLAEGMKSAENALQTALVRNVAAGRVVRLDRDLYVHPQIGTHREEDDHGPATNDLGD